MIEDVIRRLQQDRRILERELRQSRITQAFDAVRVVPVAEPQAAELEILPEMIVEPAPPRRPLAEIAAPLLQQIQTDGSVATQPHRRRYDGGAWDLGEEPVVDDLSQLLSDCEVALGFKPREESPMKTTQVGKKAR
jgi:hypothetical protein